MYRDYWKNYYSKNNFCDTPSLFADFILKNYIYNKDNTLIELGCGNGRDSIYFSKNGLNVTAVDQVKEEIDFLQRKLTGLQNLKFKSGDFTKLDNKNKYDIVYSRFTLHSIDLLSQNRVVIWANKQLKKNGIFCIEARGKKNELYKKGEPVLGENDAFIFDNHYRRFIDFDSICCELKDKNFTLEFASESKGFSPFKNTDETFIRIIARK